MEDVTNVYFSPLPDSPYVKPFRLNYTQNGTKKSWDLLEVHDSVAVIVFNITRKVMIFVKQFRPAIYYNCVSKSDRQNDHIDTEKYAPKLGVALEICAGIVDKNISLDEIAREEILEECGYNVRIEELQKVMTYRAGVGVQGAVQTLYYCEVTDAMKTEQGINIAFRTDTRDWVLQTSTICPLRRILFRLADLCQPRPDELVSVVKYLEKLNELHRYGLEILK